jgi:RNA polymerase sigma factor (sigma-70 family)
MKNVSCDIERLIYGCVKEDKVSQRELYTMFAGKMMTVCMRYSKDVMEAEDILQEGFIKIYNNISKFRMQGSFEGWVRRIMVNTAINKIRAGKRLFEELNDTNVGIAVNQTVIEDFSAMDILKLIESMPEGYKYVFNMHAIEGFSHREIANSLGIKEASSRSQYAKAKKYLQKRISL